jgi:cation:H+ antiporter
MMYLQILGGFILLLGGAEVMIRGAVAVSQWFGISTLVIGMTVIALGTSAPELVVGLDAALAGAPALALGNVVGSNIANILLVLGAAALIKPILINPHGFTGDSAMLVGGSVVFVVICLFGVIAIPSGIVLLIGFAGFLYYSYWRETKGGDDTAGQMVEDIEEMPGLPKSLWLAWVMLLGGIAAVVWGADLLVDGGITLARAFGVTEEVIGLTLVAFGTSLPELAASVVAALRGHSGVALGNVVGSNLFNILGIPGVVALVTTLPVPHQIATFDLWIMIAVTVLLVPVLRRGWRLGRPEAVLFLVAYFAYIGAQTYGVSDLLALAG